MPPYGSIKGIDLDEEPPVIDQCFGGNDVIMRLGFCVNLFQKIGAVSLTAVDQRLAEFALTTRFQRRGLLRLFRYRWTLDRGRGFSGFVYFRLWLGFLLVQNLV